MTLLPLLSLLLAPIVPGVSGDGLTGPGVSRALAERRAAQIAQVRYALQLDVTRRDTALGHARVRFVRRGGGDVILDFRGLGYSNVMANGATASPRMGISSSRPLHFAMARMRSRSTFRRRSRPRAPA